MTALDQRLLKLEYEGTLDEKADQPISYIAELVKVEGNVKVDGKPGFAWHIPIGSTQPAQILNRKVNFTSGLKVLIGIIPGNEELEVVDLALDSNVGDLDLTTDNVTLHADSHRLEGGDFLWIDPENINPLSVFPNGGLTIKIAPGWYTNFNGNLNRFDGLLSLDLTSSQPTSGNHRGVGIYITILNTIGTIEGDIVPTGARIPLPDFPKSVLELAVVDLSGDATDLSYINDITVIRPISGAGVSNREPQNTGLLSGGDIIDGAFQPDFTVEAGTGVIVDSYTIPDVPVITQVVWSEFADEAPLNIATEAATLVFIDDAGSILKLNSATPTIFRENIFLGGILHNNTDTTSIKLPFPVVAANTGNYLFDYLLWTGSEIKDFRPVPNANLTFDMTSGEFFAASINWQTDRSNPNRVALASQSPATFAYATIGGIISQADTIVDVANFNSTGTTIIPIDTTGDGGANRSAVHRLHFVLGELILLYPQQFLDTLDEAIDSIATETPTYPELLGDHNLIAYIVVRRAATDLSDVTEAAIISKSGGGGGTGGGGASNWVRDSTTIPLAPFLKPLVLGDSIVLEDTGGIGIGTDDIPHAGVGLAKLAIEGVNASADGPHIQLTTALNDFPLFQILPWVHDDVSANFDAYWDGSNWKSSDPGSNFQIRKASDSFAIRSEFGVAAGSNITWDDRLLINSTHVVINEGGLDLDTRIEGSSDPNLFYVDASTNRVGVGTTTPGGKVDVVDTVTGSTGVQFRTRNLATTTNSFVVMNFSANNGGVIGQLIVDGLGTGPISGGGVNIGTSTSHVFELITGNVRRVRLDTSGNVIIGTTTALGKLHVHNTAVQPVLYLNQTDVSEEMMEFATTIGVGNAIEAVAAKTLTPTHFVKVTLPGGLTRYFEVGTIA